MTQRRAGIMAPHLPRLAALVSLGLLVAGCSGPSGKERPTGADTGATLGTGIGSGTPDAEPADGGAFGTGGSAPSERSEGDSGRY